MLKDMQGAEMCANCIFESIEEIAEKFISYAECDNMTDQKLTNWTISDMLDHWQFDLKMWDYLTQTWQDVVGSHELNYIHNKIQK